MTTGSEISTRRKTVRDLVEEAKKRVVLLLICVFGLSYLMSLTSSSVWVNFPCAAAIIIFFRYISLDLDTRRRTTVCNKPPPVDQSSQMISAELQRSPFEKTNWKRKVNSPVVEAAIEQFTRHLVTEWVTDLWYSRVTPDMNGPEELVQIMHGVFGEVSSRARDVNLINLLTRDIINLICNHLELYRLSQGKIGKQELEKLPIDLRDVQFRMVLAADNKLHPALFSVGAEHKVLQHLVNGLITLTFKSEDLQCAFFRLTVRELLACTVIRPVLNLANPRFLNQKIESSVLSFSNKGDKTEEAPNTKLNGPPRPSVDQISGFQDPGVELVQVRHEGSKNSSKEQRVSNGNGTFSVKDPKKSATNLIGVDDAIDVTMSDKTLPGKSNLVSSNGSVSRPTGSLPSDIQNTDGKEIETCSPGGTWAQMLDIISRRKTQALAPEHFDNMWTKGRNYKKKEGKNQMEKQVVRDGSLGITETSQHSALPIVKDDRTGSASKRNTGSFHNEDTSYMRENLPVHADHNGLAHHSIMSYQQVVEPDSESSYPTEDDDNNNVTGLDSPGTRVWDSKSKKNVAISHIRHPLETSDFHLPMRSGKGHVRHPRALRTSSGRKRSRSSNLKAPPIWHEVERASFLSGDGQDILNASEKDSKSDELSDDQDREIWGRIHRGTAASSSMSSISASDSCNSSLKSPENYGLADSFLKLRCEVSGANVVKSGSVTFAIYSIAVTDANNNSWSIKRRFRHFEELHRRLKEFAEYNLSLPPKHFLSSGLDVPIVQERCKMLDKYLKKLLQLPTISGSIEVWDFLSVDSQTYLFSDSLSIIQTLSVDLDDKQYEKSVKNQSPSKNVNEHIISRGENLSSASKENAIQMNKNNYESDSLGLRKKNTEQNMGTSGTKAHKDSCEDNTGSDSDKRIQKDASASSKSDNSKDVKLSGPVAPQGTSQILEASGDSAIPNEWVPPNLSVPILSLVDEIFQLHDGGWIRRQAFWVAKQLLQLGMGDAFDDWLIEKIQLIRRGSVIASGIKRVEHILWPDGIFLTKHPSRKPQTPAPSPPEKNNGKETMMTSEQHLEAARRAKFVRELIVDKAPAALVGLVGRKEYERCAEDVYFFLQSPLFLKQLAFELLEMLLLAAFPELDDVVRQCHEEKEQFGVLQDFR